MPNHAANILVFDSGVGGLSIVDHLRNTLENSNLIYLADNQLFPYGLLEEQELIDRVSDLLLKTSTQYNIDIIIVACNSASTLVLPRLRELLPIPIVGVVPAIKPAALLSSNKVIGLLATPGTIQRDYTDTLIGNFANDCEIIRVGSTELVQLVEHKMAGAEIPEHIFSDILMPFRTHPHWQQMDTMVLACTHFPLVCEELRAAAPDIKHWIDSGEAIARRVKQLIDDKTAIAQRSNQTDRALLTNISALSPALTATFNRFGFEQINAW